MGGKKIKFIAYTVIVVFILSIVYFAGSIYIDLQNGPERAQAEFTAFAEETSKLMYSASFPDENYIKNLQDTVLNNSRIAAVLLSVENEIQFAYPISSKLVMLDDKGIPNLHVSSPLLKTFSSVLPAQQGQNAIIKAAVYVLHPQDIYDSARISFLIILACTLIVLILLACLTGSSKNQSEPLEDAQTDYTYIKTKTTEPQKTVTEAIPFVFRNPDESSYQFPKYDGETQENKTGDCESAFDGNEAHTEIEKSNEPEKKFEDEIHPEYQDESIISDPMGLFSDMTGVGWESYMETRLDAELVRAASSEQDLTLMFVRIKDIDENKQLLKKAATILLDYFKFRDFVFEYKKDGFAGILLNINLDQAMLVAESLHEKLVDLVLGEGLPAKIGIGLSTRTLRLIPGSRIITEANEAVEKSFSENDLPIVAFRVNPEKYRQFVAGTPKSLP